jgi:hypothetical protein
LLDEPFECEAPLLALGALLLADFGFDAFGLAFGLAFALAFVCVFGFAFDDGFATDDFARLGADRFFALVFV